MPEDSAGPLSDLLVLDLTRALAGPHAAMMLGDMGARVIKVEPPAGDDTRSWGPPFVGPDEVRESTYFLSANRNKESLVLDLKSDSDREVLARLVARADVLMENYRVGVLDRLGFPVSRLHELNPGLVVLSITGFGHDGPEASRAGYDQIAQGEGGLMSITGTEHPTKVGVPIADLIAGMNGAFGVVAALHERSRTGHGRVVRTSLLAGMVGVHAFQGTRWTVADEVPGPGRRPPPVDRAVRHVRDGHGTDPDRLRLRGTLAGTVRRVRTGIRATTGSPPTRSGSRTATSSSPGWSRTSPTSPQSTGSRCWMRRAFPSGKVRSMDDVYSWEQALSQGLLLHVEHPTLGEIDLPGCPIRLDDQTHSGGRASTSLPRPSASTTSRSGSGWTHPPLVEEGAQRLSRNHRNGRLDRSQPVLSWFRDGCCATSSTTDGSATPDRRWRRPGRRRRGPGGPPRPRRRRRGRR